VCHVKGDIGGKEAFFSFVFTKDKTGKEIHIPTSRGKKKKGGGLKKPELDACEMTITKNARKGGQSKGRPNSVGERNWGCKEGKG